MFGHKAARIAELEKMCDDLGAMLHAETVARAHDPQLINIRTNDRELILTFQRGDERFELMTYLTNASDVKGLKKWAGLL